MTARRHSERTRKALRRSEELSDQQLRLGHRMSEAFGSTMYLMDFYAFGALKRSLSVSAAFRSVVSDWNLVTARAVLRLQLDTALRFYAAFLVTDPNEFVRQILDGTAVRNITAHDGKKMTDRYLVRRLGRKLVWLERVYDETSGYIHFSSSQFFAAVMGFDGSSAERSMSVAIRADDDHMPDSSFEEVVECFNHCTSVLMHYLVGWIETKENPQRAQAARRDPSFDQEDV